MVSGRAPSPGARWSQLWWERPSSTTTAVWSLSGATRLVDAGTAVAWLTVDRDDNNVVWFLTHLVEAIRRVSPEVTTDLAEPGRRVNEHR